jgi:uncharacterized lipoprotein YddW (UPF0748 family)
MEAVATARSLRDNAKQCLSRRQFPQAMEEAASAHQHMVEAFCLVQEPLPGEFRAFWCHSAFGVEGMSWDEAIHRLADSGVTAILPNMLWGGAAFYASRVLPTAPSALGQEDQLALCLAACRKYGVQLHVWKVNWNLGHTAPAGFVAQMRREARLQADDEGRRQLWLCPSHPANQQLEIDSMVELVRNYPVDGIHFDYIRYPDAEHCYCAGCRERFQRATGISAQPWPKAVLADGAARQQWLNWRRSNITVVVKAVSEQVRALNPKIKISAAVFSTWTTDRDSIAQDWKFWCDRGYLDFVCPMDYTSSNGNFENLVAKQMDWAGRTPCYPGIGASATVPRLDPDQVIEQINVTRRHHTGGFVIFNYALTESEELLPMLGLGITARR